MPKGRWICQICESTGERGIEEYKLHYDTHHYELEAERRRYGAKV
jgi:hypothetical protein